MERVRCTQKLYFAAPASSFAHDNTGCANDTSATRISIEAADPSLQCLEALHAPDDAWSKARWKGSDPGPNEAVCWPSLDVQKSLSPTALKRWRALRAAHDIMWGDPLSAAFAADFRIKPILAQLPNGILRRHQDPYRQTTRVLQFTKEAVQQFLQHHRFTRVIRGHQGKGAGEWLQWCWL